MNYKNKYLFNDLLLCYVLAVFPKLLFVCFAYPFEIAGDEIWTLSSAAKLAGFDWSGIMEGGRYYGMGFYSLFFPLFKAIKSPVLLYRTILTICVFLNGGISIIAYYIIKYFGINLSRIIHILTSVICSYIVTYQIVFIYNEHIYVLLCWGIIFLLLLLNASFENRRRHLLYSLLLTIIMIYAIFIHARAVTIWIGIALIEMLYRIIYKKWLIDIKILLFFGIIGYFLANKAVELQIAWLWQSGTSEIDNVAVYNGGLKELLNPQNWQAWMTIIWGQIFSGDIWSGGLLITSLVLAISTIVQCSLREKKEKLETKFFIIFTFCLVCIGVTIGGQSISWLGGVKEAIDTKNQEADAWRAVVYLRYYMAYAVPMMLAGVFYLIKHIRNLKQELIYIVWTKLIVYGVWAAFILPNTLYVNKASSPFRAFALQHMTDNTTGIRTYVLAILVAILLYAFVLLAYYKKSYIFVVILFMLFFGYRYSYDSMNFLKEEREYFQNVNGIYNLASNNLEVIDDLDTIYVAGDRRTKDELQFLFRNSIILDATEIKTNYIVFAGKEYEIPEESNIYFAEIDENEFIFAKGKENIKKIERLGIELKAYKNVSSKEKL